MDFIPVCPEVEIGLGVPRSSFRIVSSNGEPRLIQLTTGLEVTKKVKTFSTLFLSYFIGCRRIYLKISSHSRGMKM